VAVEASVPLLTGSRPRGTSSVVFPTPLRWDGGYAPEGASNATLRSVWLPP
jgi:hypothetical protein